MQYLLSRSHCKEMQFVLAHPVQRNAFLASYPFNFPLDGSFSYKFNDFRNFVMPLERRKGVARGRGAFLRRKAQLCARVELLSIHERQSQAWPAFQLQPLLAQAVRHSKSLTIRCVVGNESSSKDLRSLYRKNKLSGTGSNVAQN